MNFVPSLINEHMERLRPGVFHKESFAFGLSKRDAFDEMKESIDALVEANKNMAETCEKYLQRLHHLETYLGNNSRSDYSFMDILCENRVGMGHGVYVIWPAGSQFVKIGLTKHVSQRMSDLQIGHPNDLKLLNWFKCKDARQTKALESLLHSEFHQYRAAGEHFSLTKHCGGFSPVWDFVHAFIGDLNADGERAIAYLDIESTREVKILKDGKVFPEWRFNS